MPSELAHGELKALGEPVAVGAELAVLVGLGIGDVFDFEHAANASETTASPIPSVRGRVRLSRANVERPLYRMAGVPR